MKSELGHIYITRDGKRFVSEKEAKKHELTMAPDYIEMPVYYGLEDNGEYVFDLDEMANDLEIRILKHLHIDCKVEIIEK